MPPSQTEPSQVEPIRSVILAVDDEQFILNSLKRELRQEPFDLLTATSAQEALEVLARCEREGIRVAAVISDYKMPGMDGVELLERVKERWPITQRILLTAYASAGLLENAINRGEIHRFLNKPWERTHLKGVLISACEQFWLTIENRQLVQERAAQAACLEAQNVQLRELNARLLGLNENLEEMVNERALQLKNAKRELATTFDAIRDPVLLIDDNFTIQRANSALASHCGRQVTDLRGHKCHELVASSSRPCEGCPIEEARASSRESHSRISLPGQDVIIEVTAFPCLIEEDEAAGQRFVCLYRDITEEERRRRKLFQRNKMASLGEMAGVVAHEINNPLGGILAFAQIMKREVDENDEKHQFLDHIEESARRCQGTVRNLLNYARFAPQEERQLVELGTLMDKAVTVFGNVLRLSGVELAMIDETPGCSDVRVRVNSDEVQGVLLNLLHNAVDAMEDVSGRIEIRKRIDDSTEPPTMILKVVDQGCGIAPEHIDRIFDPFFTTKEEGRGTGLGLSISFQIVHENNGSIEVSSALGQGATFTVSFPIALDRRGAP